MAKTSLQFARSRLSRDIRPQDDFYDYVNQHWIDEVKIPADKGRWGVFEELQENNFKKLRRIVTGLKAKNIKNHTIEGKVYNFYRSAHSLRAQTHGLKTLLHHYSRIDKIDGLESLMSVVASMHLLGIYVFWQPYVERDDKNSSQYILRLHQGGLSLPSRDYYLSRSPHKGDIRRKYKRHITKMFSIRPELHQPLGAVKNIYGLEYKLAQASMTSVDLRDVKAQYNKLTNRHLRRRYSHIDWDNYFKNLGIDEPKELIVDQPDFLKCANRLMARANLDQLKRYLKWHLLNYSAPRLGDKFAQVRFEFFGKVLYGRKSLEPLWQRAISDIDATLGEALGKLYIDEYFPPAAQARIQKLVEDLRTAYAQRIKHLDWMDPATKSYALKKLANIRVKVGYPRKLEQYHKLAIEKANYLANYLAGMEYNSKLKLAKLGRPIDPDDWDMTPPTVNAYFHPQANEMAFPAGILQPPFFDHRADDGLNYGGIGYVIGHELTHGFDDQGRQFDKDGNLNDWWDPQTAKKFEARSRQMVKLANSYQATPDTRVNGQLTLGENIADLGGLEIAFGALKLANARSQEKPVKGGGLAWEERFFLGAARVWRDKTRRQTLAAALLVDPHAPAKFRINNSFRNMEVFYEVFGVQPPDKMYLPPSQRVKIW